MEEQEPVSFEEYYEPLDVWFEMGAYPSEDGLSVYFRDITEEKRREQNIRAFTEVFPDIGFVIDEDGIYREGFVYSEKEELLYTETNQVEGSSMGDILPQDVAGTLSDSAAGAIEKDGLVKTTYELEVPAGTRTFETRVTPTREGLFALQRVCVHRI